MQLILTHADLELALIESLRSKGMTAFEPGKASVDFSFKRGTKELQCVLDTEPKAEAPVAVKPTAISGSAPVADPVTPATEPEAPVAEPVREIARDPEPAAQAGENLAAVGEDNLFD